MNALAKDDWKKIGQNIILYDLPVFAIAILTGLATGQEMKATLIAASITFLKGFINIGAKIRECQKCQSK